MVKSFEGWIRTATFVERGLGGEAFSSVHAINRFIRLHKKELVEGGACLPARGTKGTLLSPKFAPMAYEILAREALEDEAA